MQLRTIKKPKRKDDDIGYEYQQPQTQKKHHQQKPHNEKEGHSSNEVRIKHLLSIYFRTLT